MSAPTIPVPADNDATVAVRVCPRCLHPMPLESLAKNAYRCEDCNFELAYLDHTPTGGIRGVLGWIKKEGEVIQGRYRITSVLGRGGFGTTYLVQDQLINGKRRALKEIPESLFDEAEARLLSSLDHPGIPDIIDRAEQGGMVHLVLEFGGTRTLGSERQRLGGRIPLALLIPWMQQLCKVLSFLHRQEPPIIHRDLKPDNILLDDQDHVMLIDFGIAKLADPREATRTLGRAVSFGFSAPEQVLGTGTNHKSDIYSLGATVYYLLTGIHVPDMHAHLAGKGPEPLAKLAPDVPPLLERHIMRAIDLNPERRQDTVDELTEVFESLQRTIPRRLSDTGTLPQLPSHRSQNILIVAALVLCSGLLAAAGWFWLAGQQAETGKATLEPAPLESPQPVIPPPVATPDLRDQSGAVQPVDITNGPETLPTQPTESGVNIEPLDSEKSPPISDSAPQPPPAEEPKEPVAPAVKPAVSEIPVATPKTAGRPVARDIPVRKPEAPKPVQAKAKPKAKAPPRGSSVADHYDAPPSRSADDDVPDWGGTARYNHGRRNRY